MRDKKLNNKIRIIPSDYSKQFIKNFNNNKPTEEFIESCKKARELFGEENDKSTEQNVADVPSGDTISRANVLALINKAMNNTDNKDIQDYIFCGLRRDVHNLSSIDRPRGEWLDEYGDKVEIDDNGITEDSCWCSVCGEWLVASDEYPTKGNFCPNCGADMRGEK